MIAKEKGIIFMAAPTHEDDTLKIIDETQEGKVARTKKDNPVKWEVNLR